MAILPMLKLYAERLTVGSLSKTSVVIVYIAGLTNPELIEEARKK
ncbi:spore germination protein, partial [Bacillus licheniformis]